MGWLVAGRRRPIMAPLQSWRILILVVGFDQSHWQKCPRSPVWQQIVDVRQQLPQDPADEVEDDTGKGKGKGKSKSKGKGKEARPSCVDSVAVQPGFVQCVLDCVQIAHTDQRIVIGCRRGKHRSPVVAACVRELLSMCGYAVGVIECGLCQLEMVVPLVNLAEDWVEGRVARMDFLSQYSNFELFRLAETEVARRNLNAAHDQLNALLVSQQEPAEQAVEEQEEEHGEAVDEAGVEEAGVEQAAEFAEGEQHEADEVVVQAEQPYVAEEPPYRSQGVGSASSSSGGPSPIAPSSAPPSRLTPRQPNTPPPKPPTPPAAPASAPSVLTDVDMAAVQEFSLDEAAVAALTRLAATSVSEKNKVINKLHTKKAAGKKVDRPSAFVTISCQNAIDKKKKR